MPLEMNAIFAVRGVTFRYREVTALADLSLTIKQHQRVALLGANGSGKSTLLRLLDALYFPTQGTISAFGRHLTEAALADDEFAFHFRRRVAFVFQNPEVQLFNPTVFDELAFAPLQLRWPPQVIRERVAEMLEVMEIAHLKQRAPHRLSGGEKKRVALASVLILDPEVLLLDEPTAALDPTSHSRILDLLISWRGAAKTVITATHDLATVADTADYCFVLHNGRLARAGSPAQILRDHNLLKEANLLRVRREPPTSP